MKKTIITTIIILNLITLNTVLSALISVYAQTNVTTSISLTVLSFGTSFNAVPIDTVANVALEINPAPPTYQDRFTNFTFTVIQPDGVERKIPMVFGLGGNVTGGLYTDLTSIVGTWILKASFLGQTFDNGITYLPSENQTTYTVVPNTLPTPSYSPPLEITINVDGTINPSNVAIAQKGNTYSMTDNITGRITVKKSNIVFDGDGHTLTYAERGPGNIYALGISASNNTVKNLTVIGGWYGISLYKATNTLIVNNTISETVPFTAPFNPSGAVSVEFGSLNVIIGNNLANNYVGFRFFETNNNLIVGNNIENSSSLGLGFSSGSNNTVYHNNFVNNAKQVGVSVFDSPSSGNVWDNGYPLGGNYWSDYKKKYPDAAEIDSSGIGDTAYVIDSQNEDRYPLIKPFTSATYLLQTTPPTIFVLSPTPASAESNVSLVFTVDKLVDWTGYSLDGQQNVTVTGNATLTGLSSGLHIVTVYANDTYGNMGASEAVAFTVSEPFPTTLVAVASGVLIAVVGLGLLFYFKKRKH